MYHMITVTATEAARSFSAILDQAERGATITIVRGGHPVATINPPHRANGAAIIDAYANHADDPEFADAVADAHRLANVPVEVTDPWADA